LAKVWRIAWCNGSEVRREAAAVVYFGTINHAGFIEMPIIIAWLAAACLGRDRGCRFGGLKRFDHPFVCVERLVGDPCIGQPLKAGRRRIERIDALAPVILPLRDDRLGMLQMRLTGHAARAAELTTGFRARLAEDSAVCD